jgi:hypothetical protein
MVDFGAKNAMSLADGVWSTWFFYGDSGSGKTTLASSFPKPVFVVPRVEGSIETLRGMDFPYFEVTSAKPAAQDPLRDGAGSMDAVISHLENVYKAAVNAGKQPPFDTIVQESLSHYNDLIVADLTQNGALQMDQGKWGLQSNRLMGMHVRMRALDCHTVYTALAKLDIFEDKTKHGGPLLSGQPAAKLPAACATVGYVELHGGKQHRVHLTKYMHWHARSRFKRLPKVYDGPFDIFYSEIAHLLSPGV